MTGIKVLARIVQIDARYAMQHQALVMQCLEHTDPTIQTKVCLTVPRLSSLSGFQNYLLFVITVFGDINRGVCHSWL